MSWPAPQGVGLRALEPHGIVLYNVEDIEPRHLYRTADVVRDWYWKAEEGSPWARALALPGSETGWMLARGAVKS